MHGIEIDRVHNLSSSSLLCHQPRVYQRFQMIGECGRGHLQMLTDLSDIQPFMTHPYQQAEKL